MITVYNIMYHLCSLCWMAGNVLHGENERVSLPSGDVASIGTAPGTPET